VRRLLVRLVATVLLLLPGGIARAHPLSPAALVLRERQQGTYEVSFRRSELAAQRLELTFPPSCRQSVPRPGQVGDQREDRFELVCAQGLAGLTVGVQGLTEVATSMLVYTEFSNGQHARSLLTAAQPNWTLPRQTGALDVFREFLSLGIQHLLTGWDHLLFILGLMFLARGLTALVFTLTAFTLGHSITLCLAALGLVSVPAAPVELGIALSLLALALALMAPARPEPLTPSHGFLGALPARWRLPILALSLGLLHGLGFASALSETGLPAHQITVSLLGFNLGVECAQLAIVIPLSALGLRFDGPPRQALQRGAAFVIGALSACWCIERALVWMG
jgi:hydrogenase/urease accessory protein HupE